MEKKNTMLLTVIAVATLLVAVVGATFAYFSLTVSGEATATKAEVTTGKTGLFTFTQENQNISLNIASGDMAKGLIDGTDVKSVDYFAKADGGKTTKNNSTEAEQKPVDTDYISISKLSLSNADSGTKYHCEGKYTINVTAIETAGSDVLSELKDAIQEADGKLYLKAKGVDGVTMNISNDEIGHPAESGVETVDHSLQSLMSEDKIFWVTYDFTANSSTIDAELQVALKISNENADQNYLANRTITVTLTPDAGAGKLACNIAEGAK